MTSATAISQAREDALLTLTVNIGQAVQIGDETAVKVNDKQGRRVRLVFFTRERVRLLADGIIPPRLVYGINEAEAVPRIHATA